jgi:hypothetical protein
MIEDYPPVPALTMELSLLVRVAREIPRALTI